MLADFEGTVVVESRISGSVVNLIPRDTGPCTYWIWPWTSEHEGLCLQWDRQRSWVSTYIVLERKYYLDDGVFWLLSVREEAVICTSISSASTRGVCFAVEKCQLCAADLMYSSWTLCCVLFTDNDSE